MYRTFYEIPEEPEISIPDKLTELVAFDNADLQCIHADDVEMHDPP